MSESASTIRELPAAGAGKSHLVGLVSGYFCACVVMNFFVPSRDLVSALEFTLTAAVWILVSRGAVSKSGILITGFFCYYVLVAVNVARGGNPYFLAKLVTYPLEFGMMLCVGRRLGSGQARRIAKGYLAVFALAFAANALLSFHVGDYEERRLWAFAHVNLAGSYVAGTVIPLSVVLSTGSARGTARRLLMVVEAALTRSSGAFLSSLVVLIDARRVHLRSAILTVATVAVMLGAVLEIGAAFNAPYYSKLRDAAAVVQRGDVEKLWVLAKHRAPLAELGRAGGGSLSWRFYAYLVYGSAIAAMPPLSLVVGAGAGSYRQVWDGYMPHNDFLLVMHDFGAVGELIFVFAFGYMAWRFRRRPVWLAALTVLGLRLLFENCVYSAWLMTSWATWLGLACGALGLMRRSYGPH